MIVIGDVHGCYDTLVALLGKLPKDAEVCFVGDLIDRGPKSAQIVDLVMNNPKYHCVMGNHEKMMVDETKIILEYIARTGMMPLGVKGTLWTVNGGLETLDSYVSFDEDNLDDRGLPTKMFDFDKFEEHSKWMKSLPLYLEFDEFDDKDRKLVVSHSIIKNWKNKDVPGHKHHFENTVLWGRDFSGLRDQGIFNIIGHTPQEGSCTVKSMYANVDTGACFKGIGFGTMTAIEFPSMKIITQENIDDY
jgi:serine/threonine protein phosphatase 1